MSDTPRGGGRLERLEGLPLVGGFLAGLTSFLGGYALLVGLLAATGELTFSRGVGTALRSVAQIFYNTFNVPTYTRQTLRIEQGGQVSQQITEVWANSVTGFQSLTRTRLVDGQVVNEVSGGGTAPTLSGLPELVYLAVPVVAIVAVGLALGYRGVELDSDDPNEIAIESLGAGVAMATGFLVLSLGCTYLLVRSGQNAVLHPARFEAVLYGIAYPLLGGTTSVGLGLVLQHRATDSGPTTGSDRHVTMTEPPADGVDRDEADE